MSFLYAILLGILQGLTEFLPISSSGHLVIAQQIFGIEEADMAFDIILHLGTLVAVLAYYWKDILQLIGEFFTLISQLFKGEKPKLLDPHRPYRILLVMVVVATIPTALIGFLFKDLFVKLFGGIYIVGYALVITGVLLWVSNGIIEGKKRAQNITLLDATTVGLLQGLAITPGISRSGSTIFAGLLRGFNRELATRFSFLLSIPAILGAVILEGKEIFKSQVAIANILPILAGFLAAAISGYFAIHILIRLLQKKKLNYFAYYCWAVGLLTILYSWVMA